MADAHTNLTLLHRRFPAIAGGLFEHLRHLRLGGGEPAYRIGANGAGDPVLLARAERNWITLQSLADERAMAEASAAQAAAEGPDCAAIASAGAGSVPAALARTLPRAKIILAEPSYDILFEALRASDWSALLASPSFHLFAGPKAADAFANSVRLHPSLAVNAAVYPGRVFLEGEEDWVANLQTAFQKASEKRTGPSLDSNRVAAASAEAHHDLLPDLSRALRLLGLPSAELPIRPDFKRFATRGGDGAEAAGRPFPSRMVTFSPAVFEPDEWKCLRDEGTECLLWCYDDPARGGIDPETFALFDRVYCFDPEVTRALRIAAGREIEYMPGGARERDPEREGSESPFGEEWPVTFVGSTGLQRYGDAVWNAVARREPLYRTVEDWVRNQYATRGAPGLEDIENLMRTAGPLGAGGNRALAQDLATFAARRMYLGALRGLPLRIFGDLGWGEPALAGPLRDQYAGRSLDYVRETPWMYRSSRVNLNLFNVQCVNSPTVRMLDAMARGGFVLTEHRPFLEDLFPPGDCLDSFKTPDELRAKVGYYLKHEDERRAIAERGREAVLRGHTLRHRLAEMLGMPFADTIS